MNIDDRMKMYENLEAGRRLMPYLPVMARVDGRCFHRFCGDLQRPYETALHDLMVGTTRALMEETGAIVGYTQSDEITFCWFSPTPDSQIWFDGRVMKMVSLLSATATAVFNRDLPRVLPQKAEYRPFPTFDARVWTVPSLSEAVNCFVWRELDATRNSVTMATRAVYSHGEVVGKKNSQMQEMLHAKGINWSDYPSWFKRGTYLIRRKTRRPLTAEEIESLPPGHDARGNPGLLVDRSDVRDIEMPPLVRVANPVGVMFGNEDPIEKSNAET
jgi:tRNA(His) 5'-end guanylyltransferase